MSDELFGGGEQTQSALPPVMGLFEHLVHTGREFGQAADVKVSENRGEGAYGEEAEAESGHAEPVGVPGERELKSSGEVAVENVQAGFPGVSGEAEVKSCGEDTAGDMLLPFAYEETLCRDVGSGLLPAALHLWSHPGGVALGLRDSRLPGAAAAMTDLERQGIRTAVRHSGGAAVPLDAGIVNVSLILPKPAGKLDFHDDFRLLAVLIRDAVAVSHPQAAALIRAGEVAGSYCPGDFDLAVGGRKFCGIAQRRQQGAYFVHAFVVVSGSGRERGELIRAFYEAAAGGDDALDYPRVRPDTIAALGELGGPDSAELFAEGIRQAAVRRGVRLLPAAQLRREQGYALRYGDARVLEAARVLRERYAR
ncbi:lipoate--protein ligase family protein [Paenibacillus tepidiphilus]|uniref:lipoate--protein ligase family protein n=1 Tax=Paenibacillus tepidiphilus TaxID=2608683 RepID=UPI0013A58B89|nr:lipoate--protein ligase family protein [Paenibacillus tepidiphilus]